MLSARTWVLGATMLSARTWVLGAKMLSAEMLVAKVSSAEY